jgi:hypothetical protein
MIHILIQFFGISNCIYIICIEQKCRNNLCKIIEKNQTMGNVFGSYFGKKRYRILMLGLGIRILI